MLVSCLNIHFVTIFLFGRLLMIKEKKVNSCDSNKNSHSQSIKQDNCGKICLFMYSISMIGGGGGGGGERVKMASKAFNKLA